MNTKITILMIAALLAVAGCRNNDKLSRKQQQYDTVQEGVNPGTNPNLGAEALNPPAMTGTNADTTSAFTLDPNAIATTTTQAPGTIAGTLPPPMNSSGTWGSTYERDTPVTATSRPRPRPVTPPAAAPPPEPEPAPTPTEPEPAPAPETEPTPAPTTNTDTTATEAPKPEPEKTETQQPAPPTPPSEPPGR